MGSKSTQHAAAATKTMLAPVMTLEGHKGFTWSMAYFPDGKRMISVFKDKTIRQWDLQAGKEIEEVRDVYKRKLDLAVVSRDGQWVITSDEEYKELKAYEVKTGIVKTFQDSRVIHCIDISADGKFLATAGYHRSDYHHHDTVLIWRMDTGELVAGPLESDYYLDPVLLSPDSKKLVVKLNMMKGLEVWDVQTQKLDARVEKKRFYGVPRVPILWTKKGTILAVFNFFDGDVSELRTIYEFDASTLETIGDPFEGHTNIIRCLALSLDGTLLASSCFDNTINLWAFEPRQLLASFCVQHKMECLGLIFSPDTRQLAHSADEKIFICAIPSDILTSIRVAPDAQTIAPGNSILNDLLNSDASRRRNPARLPMISLPPRPLQSMNTRGLQQPVFLRHLRDILSFSFHLNAVPAVQSSQPRDPLDTPATSSRIHDNIPVRHTTQGHSHSDPREHPRRTAAPPSTLSSASPPATFGSPIQHLSRWWPAHASHPQPPIVDVPLAPGQLRHAAAGAPKNDEDLIPDEYFDTSSQNPDSQRPSAAAQIDTGEHDHGGSCFCF